MKKRRTASAQGTQLALDFEGLARDDERAIVAAMEPDAIAVELNRMQAYGFQGWEYIPCVNCPKSMEHKQPGFGNPALIAQGKGFPLMPKGMDSARFLVWCYRTGSFDGQWFTRIP